MGDAGYFRGTTFEQDSRFTDKQKKLMKALKFADHLSKKVDMKKVNLEVMKPWISERITKILNTDDEVVVDFILNQLEEKNLDPRTMQINITGFLNAKGAREFMSELWEMLLDAQEDEDGIPQKLVELKKIEIKKKMNDDDVDKPRNNSDCGHDSPINSRHDDAIRRRTPSEERERRCLRDDERRRDDDRRREEDRLRDDERRRDREEKRKRDDEKRRRDDEKRHAEEEKRHKEREEERKRRDEERKRQDEERKRRDEKRRAEETVRREKEKRREEERKKEKEAAQSKKKRRASPSSSSSDSDSSDTSTSSYEEITKASIEKRKAEVEEVRGRRGRKNNDDSSEFSDSEHEKHKSKKSSRSHSSKKKDNKSVSKGKRHRSCSEPLQSSDEKDRRSSKRVKPDNGHKIHRSPADPTPTDKRRHDSEDSYRRKNLPNDEKVKKSSRSIKTKELSKRNAKSSSSDSESGSRSESDRKSEAQKSPIKSENLDKLETVLRKKALKSRKNAAAE